MTDIQIPHLNMSRSALVEWLEDNGDDVARKAFVDNALNPNTNRFSKNQVLRLCLASYNRSIA